MASLEWTTGDRATFPNRNFLFFPTLFPPLTHFSCFPPRQAHCSAPCPLWAGDSCQAPPCPHFSLAGLSPSFVLTTPGCPKNPNTDKTKKRNSVFSLEATSQSRFHSLQRLRSLNNNLIFSTECGTAASLPPQAQPPGDGTAFKGTSNAR